VPKPDIIPLSMSVQEAIKMVISGGILTPPDRRPVEERKVPVTAARIYKRVDILREKSGVPVLVPKDARPGGKQSSAKNKAQSRRRPEHEKGP
ncbi:MAG TPA: hypothetical protein VF987_06015, partial [Rhodospirillales bacterium]